MKPATSLVGHAIAAGIVIIVTALAAAQARTVWDGVYSDAQAKRGRELYNSKCLSCHGADLSGGEMAPPLVGIGFQSNWNGLTAGDLSERIRVSMPLGAEGTLSRQQVSDIIAAIFAAGEYPAGANELPRESDVLKTIQITPRK
jgi:mono/diheme cytochrome c family protein